MKHTFPILFGILLICCIAACKKEDVKPTQQLGTLSFQINDTTITNPKDARANKDSQNNDLFEINFSIFNSTNHWPLSTLSIVKIPTKKGKSQLMFTSIANDEGRTGAKYYTLTDQGDVLEETYNIDMSTTDNYIDISYIDDGEVAGTFQANLRIDPNIGKQNPASPDVIIIRNGQFYLPLK
jgi:hypothetical protein